LGVKVTQKTIDDSGLSVIKGDGIVKTTPSKLRELLSSVEERGKWDVFFDSGELVKKLKDHKSQCLIHYKTKSSMTVWSRDFAVLAASREEQDGSITMIGKSIVTDLIPVDSSCVRATALLSGFRLIPLSNNGEVQTRIIYIFQVDVAGWVPTSISNQVNTYQPLGIIGMRKLLTGTSSP